MMQSIHQRAGNSRAAIVAQPMLVEAIEITRCRQRKWPQLANLLRRVTQLAPVLLGIEQHETISDPSIANQQIRSTRRLDESRAHLVAEHHAVSLQLGVAARVQRDDL